MPTYDYNCNDCGHRFEAVQKISDEPLTVCPNCGKPALRKIISATSFVLKGSGWYKNDTRGSGGDAPSPACGTGACPACSLD